MDERMDYLNSEELSVPEKMNIFQRLINLILSPKKLFAYIKKKPTVLFPIIFMSISSALLQLLLWEQTRGMQMDLLYNTYKNMGMSTSPAQLEALVDVQMYSTLALSPVIFIATWLVTTLLLYLVYRIVGCEKGLKKYFSMVGYISIISMIGQLIHTLFLWMTGGDLLSPSVTGLASLLSNDLQGTFLQGLASGIEVFSIWTFILYAIGFVYTGGVEKKKSYITAGILFVIVLLMTAGLSVFSSNVLGGLMG